MFFVPIILIYVFMKIMNVDLLNVKIFNTTMTANMPKMNPLISSLCVIGQEQNAKQLQKRILQIFLFMIVFRILAQIINGKMASANCVNLNLAL